MALGTTISGKLGSATVGGTALIRFKNWKIKQAAETAQSTDSDSGGWKNTVLGAKSWSGSFELNHDTGADVVVTIGSTIALVCLLKSGRTRTGSAIVTGIEEGADYEKGEVETIVVTFEGDGVLTPANA